MLGSCWHPWAPGGLERQLAPPASSLVLILFLHRRLRWFGVHSVAEERFLAVEFWELAQEGAVPQIARVRAYAQRAREFTREIAL